MTLLDTSTAIIVDELAQEPDIIAVYLFGSVAQGTAHASSDVDVAVLFSNELDVRARFDRALEIGSRLERRLRSVVDVLVLNDAPPLITFQAVKYSHVILEHDRTERCLFQMRAMNRYYDAKPYLAAQIAATVRRIKEEGLGRGYRGDRDALAEARRLREKLAAIAANPSG